jgi:hypothetical protein
MDAPSVLVFLGCWFVIGAVLSPLVGRMLARRCVPLHDHSEGRAWCPACEVTS